MLLYYRNGYKPFTRYNRLSNRLYNRFDNGLYRVKSNRLSNRFDNWLDVCLHDTAGCQTGSTTGLTTGLTTVLNEQPLFVQAVVKPSCTTGFTTGCIHDITGCQLQPV